MAPPYVSTGIQVTFPGLSAELLDVNKTDEEAEQLDGTHQLSPDMYRKWISGLVDGGEITFLLHWGGSVPERGTNGSLVVQWPGGQTMTVNANLSKGGGIAANLGEKMTSPVTFKLNGKPAWT
ncbi:MAG: hypothetical protein JW809_14965 [Pirellulales bacterium]|nr:hypothetical protein [Pirellulales bacterium]